MKARLWAASLCLLWLLPAAAVAQNAVLDVSQGTLNQLVSRLGSLADAGVYHPMTPLKFPSTGICHFIGFLDCPNLPRDLGFLDSRIPLVICRQRDGGVTILPSGNPIAWQWWVSDAHFTLASGSMTFTATVRSRVGDVDSPPVTRTVPASVSLDTSTDPVRLRIQINAFTVPISCSVCPRTIDEEPPIVTQVEVAKLYSIFIPLEKQPLTVPRPEGGSQTLNGRAVGMTAQYLPGRLRLNFDLGF